MNFYDLITHNKIIIPTIQRDYVQGRTDKKFIKLTSLQLSENEQQPNSKKMFFLETKIGSDLLDSIEAALKNKKPLNLNFIYGKMTIRNSEREFNPVDGQQRLTTLFLVHLYAFKDSDVEWLKNFSYEARETSKVFFEKLIENRKAVFDKAQCPEEVIKDSSWFLNIWLYDPTIQSTLNMLNLIQEKFRGRGDDLKEKLKDTLINFEFLCTDDLGDIDNLYIKLNARGRTLTEFEILKAKILKYYILRGDEKIKEISEKFDNQWTNYFWQKAWDKLKRDQLEKNYDKIFTMFFSYLFKANFVLGKDESLSAKTFEMEDSKLEGLIKVNRDLQSSDGDMQKTFKDIFDSGFRLLDYLSEENVNTENKEIIENLLVDGLVGKNKVVNEKTEYNTIAYCYAITQYFARHNSIDDEKLADWLRVIRNFIENTYNTEKRIQKPKDLLRVVESFDFLLDKEQMDGTIKYLSGLDVNDPKLEENHKAFVLEQIKEEILKAQWLEKNQSSKQSQDIKKYESVFSGKLGLGFVELMNGDLDCFEKYWDAIKEIFENENLDKILLRRAMLCFGNYAEHKKVDDCMCLCVDDPKESKRSPSLKSLFVDFGMKDNPDREEAGKIVENFLEEFCRLKESGKNNETALEEIIKTRGDLPLTDWRGCFINDTNLWKYRDYLRLKEIDGEIYILKTSKKAKDKAENLYLSLLNTKIPNATYIEEDAVLKIGKKSVRFENKKYIVNGKGEVSIENKKFSEFDKVAKEVEALAKK